MKKYVISSVIALALYSCGGTSTETKETKKEEPKAEATAPSLSDNPDYQKGLELVSKAENLCLSCHKIDEKVVGPAYRDVANKYENTPENIKMLAEKVVKGGSGVWGDAVMTPKPGLALSDAEQMVKYILLLRNK